MTTTMNPWWQVNKGEFWSKQSARAIYMAPGALASSLHWIGSARRDGGLLSYWTTVTARRFWLQHEMSLQMATGRSLLKDWLVMRCWLTPRDTR